MASVVIRGDRELIRRLQSTKGIQRIAGPSVRRSIDVAYRYARRNNVGFINRTGDLRRSLRIERARDLKGRFKVGFQLVASTTYAGYVEWKQRTIDKRPGPPYWLGYVMPKVRERMLRKLAAEVERAIEQEIVRTLT